VVRIVATPENDRAEFAVLVRSDQKGRGLGFQLMKDIIAAARARDIKTIHSDVLCENQTMLSMASELGFTRQGEDAGVTRISLAL
jgi:acetyltransferase